MKYFSENILHILDQNARGIEKAPLYGACHVANYRKEGTFHGLWKMPDDRKIWHIQKKSHVHAEPPNCVLRRNQGML